MSWLNDLDRNLEATTALELLNEWNNLRRHILSSQRLPKDEIQFLVLTATAYRAEAITEGRACEILQCDRLDFRDLYHTFLDGETDDECI